MVCEATLWVGSGLLQVIEELRKPGWIVQKQPAHHCLKSCGPSINRSVCTPRPPTGTVAAPPHQIEFLGTEKFTVFQPAQQAGLGVSTDIGHHSTVQLIGAPRPGSMAQALMQLPHGISNPSQLQWPQLLIDVTGRLASNPIAQAANWFRAVDRSSTR